MSPRRSEPPYELPDDTEETPASAGPDRTNGSTELTQRETFWVLFNDPSVRNYVIAAFSALAMIFLILFQQGSDLGGLLILIVGTAGITLRWIAAPAFVLVLITYFMVFPFGIPGEAYDSAFEIEDGRFRPPDLIMAMAVLVYVAAQFRIYGFVHQAVAFEGPARRPDEPVTRRPPALVSGSELIVLLAVAFGVVILAQLVWLVANSVVATPGEDFPFKWTETQRIRRGFERYQPPGALSPSTTRFVFLVGAMCVTLLFGRLVFGYWRLRMMGAAEGGMTLLDGGWLETKRERSRMEKWRIWGRKRIEEQAKAEAKAQAKAAKRDKQ